MADYVEQICQAIDIIASKKVESISYDTTLTCTITDDSQKKDGVYKVNNGSATFTAYSSNTTYSKGNTVYVQVPNGDWNEQKIILSKKPNDSDAPIAYIKPFDSFVDLSGNLILSQPKQQGLVANGERDCVTIWNYVGDPLVGYTRLGIRAGFQAWLKELGVVEGSYGLRAKINKNEKTDGYDYVLDFNCSNMIGNPYNFESFFEQEILFDVSGIEQIKEIVLEFYQDRGSFLDINKEKTPPKNEEEYKQYGQNLFIKDVYISVGYDSSAFDSDTVVIFTWNDSQYEATTDPAEKDHKKIYLRWVHKFDDGSIRVVDKNDNLSYNLYWYRKVLGEPSSIPQAGVDWRLLSQETQGSIEICDPDWETYNESSTIKREPAEGMTWLIPDVTTAEEKVKAIINLGDQYYYSNILTFTNKKEVISKPTVDAVQALSISCEDDSYGNYFIYKQGGQIVNQADASKTRTLRLHFDSALKENSSENQEAYLLEAESIEWVFPTQNTMIGLFSQNPECYDETNENYNPNDYMDRNGYRHIKKYGSVSDAYSLHGNNFYNYKINSYYSQYKNNNTIKCIVVKDKVTYTATKELTFGPTGTSGTDYTFVLDFEDNVNALTVKSDTSAVVTARLYDYEGQEVTDKITNGVGKITWSWANSNKEPIMSYLPKEETVKSDLNLSWNKATVTLGTSTVPKENYHVLKATLKGWGDYPLDAYLPIPIKSNAVPNDLGDEQANAVRQWDFISGATAVMYNSLGTLDNVSFYQNPYELYYTDYTVDKDGNKEEVIKNGRLKNATWVLSSLDGNIGAPVLKDKTVEGETLQYLQPKSIYIENTCACVAAEAAPGEGYYWSQPIWIYQNKYPSSIVNSWNGELTIDNKNNAILSAQVITGSKNSENQFSGVMMGDLGHTDGEQAIRDNTGIYGFKDGEAVYAFKDDGTAFIGKSGSGRIEFNGNKGTIAGALFGTTVTQDQINKGLNKGYDLGQYYPGVKIDLDSSPYLQIYGTQQKLLHIGDDKYYLQSNNYSASTLNEEETHYAPLGKPRSTWVFNNWKDLYGTLYYLSGTSYKEATADTDYNEYLYYSYTISSSSSQYLGSKFDLNQGTIEFNTGYINGDVILRPTSGLTYTTYSVESGKWWESYSVTADTEEKTLPEASLVNVLSELYSNVSYSKALASAAKYSAEKAKEAADDTADAINKLSYYINTELKKDSETGEYTEDTGLRMKSSTGAYILLYNAVHLYGHNSPSPDIYLEGYTQIEDSCQIKGSLDVTDELCVAYNITSYNGDVIAQGTTLTSDKRLKNNISYNNIIYYKNFFLDLKPVEFEFNNKNKKELGFIAQDVLKSLNDYNLNNTNIVSNFINQETKEYLSLNYNSIFTLNTYMLQEAYKEIDLLKQEIQELKEKIKYE